MNMTKSKTKPKNQPIDQLQHYGMWQYCLRHCADNGTFHKTSEEIRESLVSLRVTIPARNIQRALRTLVETGHLIETIPTHRDGRGWRVPATYKVVKEFLPDNTVRIAGKVSRLVKVTS